MSDCHSHHHPEALASFGRAFFIAIVANGLFVVIQIIFSYIAHSTSLLADALHNLGDVLGLILAGAAQVFQKKIPTSRATYGMKKTTILAAFANGSLLVFTCGIIATEAIYKFFSPSAVDATTVIWVATLGIIINGASALLFLRGRDDLNIRAAYLHLLSDAVISLGVVFSAILLAFTHWWWIDPLVGLLIALLILKATWSLFTDSFRLILDQVPRGVRLEDISVLLKQQPGVQGIHDLHIWALSTNENALSVHLWMPDTLLTDEARHSLSQTLKQYHGIHHATIQVEKSLGFCQDACIPYL